MVTTVAMVEPQTVAKPAVAVIAAIASPPRRCPMNSCAHPKISRDTPAPMMRLPISTNSAITAKVYDIDASLVTIAIMAAACLKPTSRPKPTNPVIPSAIAMGTLRMISVIAAAKPRTAASTAGPSNQASEMDFASDRGTARLQTNATACTAEVIAIRYRKGAIGQPSVGSTSC